MKIKTAWKNMKEEKNHEKMLTAKRNVHFTLYHQWKFHSQIYWKLFS